MTTETEFERYRRLMAEPGYSNVFVFGSNLAGIHGAGAAREAVEKYGARSGDGRGVQGKSYALPTKDQHLHTLPLEDVGKWVRKFLALTKLLDMTPSGAIPPKRFIVTRIGCGLAGYRNEEIAPLFKDAPPNCVLPDEWQEYLT